MSQASSQGHAIPTTGCDCGFSGASDAVQKFVLDRDQSVQVRVAQQRANAIRGEIDAFLMMRTVYRVGLLMSLAMLMAIVARIGNHVVYFVSGVDYHILDSVSASFNSFI